MRRQRIWIAILATALGGCASSPLVWMPTASGDEAMTAMQIHEAVEEYQRAQSGDPDNSLVLLRLASAYALLGDPERAELRALDGLEELDDERGGLALFRRPRREIDAERAGALYLVGRSAELKGELLRRQSSESAPSTKLAAGGARARSQP